MMVLLVNLRERGLHSLQFRGFQLFLSIYNFLLCVFIRNAVFCDSEDPCRHDQLEDQRRVERCEYN